MTFNAVIRRIRLLALAHKQIRTFKRGLAADFLTDHTTKYPAVFLQDSAGTINTSSHSTTLNFRMFFVDLVHVSEETKENEQDVLSDMISIAMDLLAQMNAGGFSDWRMSTNNTLQLLVEGDGDMYAGCYVDFSLSIMFKQNVCVIPTEIFTYDPDGGDGSSGTGGSGSGDLKLVYDLKYVATGEEGSTLSIPTIEGKKVLFVTRESAPIYKVSSAPSSAEFMWNDVTVTLGANTTPGERFLFLYRNY